MSLLAGEFPFSQTYPSSHTFWHVLEASGIWVLGVIVLAVVVLALLVLVVSRRGRRRVG